jgi:hypothetical protein
MSLTCLDKIIGLDRTACACFATSAVPAAIGNVVGAQAFVATTTNVLTWTQNNGVLPVNFAAALLVFQNGQKLNFSTGDYTVTPNSGYQQSTITIAAGRWAQGDNFEVIAYQEEPLDYATSNSGLYMTDVEYGLPIRDAILSAEDCDQSGIWEVMDRARTEAIRDFKRDIGVSLDMLKVRGVTPWRGAAGKIEVNAFAPLNVLYGGQLLRPVGRHPHRKVVVTAIHVGFTTTGTTPLTFRSNAQGWTDQVVNVNHTANTWTRNALATAIELPMFDVLESKLYHAVTYDAMNRTVMSNRLYCCGGASWGHLFTLSGVATNNLADLREQIGRGADGMGLVLEGYTACDELDWICDLPQLGMQQLYETVGLAVLCKATVRLLSQLLDGGTINQYTLLMDAQGYAKRDALSAKYAELVRWIATHLPAGASGCWGCSKNSFFTSQIRI